MYPDISELVTLNTRPTGEPWLNCVTYIIKYLERGELESAINVRRTESDKIRSQPLVAQWLDLNVANCFGDDYCARIRPHLTDELRKKQYRGHPNPYRGHCYVAAEVAYHLIPKEERSRWRSFRLKIGDENHWFLRHELFGLIIDPTADQFDFIPDYSKGIGNGFLTKQPSKRAQIVLDRINS